MSSLRRSSHRWLRRSASFRPDRHGLGPQAGTTTAEYAIGTLAACGFAAMLYKIVTSSSVAALLSGLIHKALGSAG
jgi:hypothetical protein